MTDEKLAATADSCKTLQCPSLFLSLDTSVLWLLPPQACVGSANSTTPTVSVVNVVWFDIRGQE